MQSLHSSTLAESQQALKQKVLEAHVRAQLDSLAEVRIDLR